MDYMTFRELSQSIVDFLATHLSVPVDHGKYGDLPQQAPAVLVYAEPMERLYETISGPLFRKAEITIFAVAGGSSAPHLAKFDAIELAEQIEYWIMQSDLKIEWDEQPLRFDAVYSDIAIAYVTFKADYRAHFEQ